jgi:hypothetical protein
LKAGRNRRLALLALTGIGAASAAAHIGNDFTTYLVGGADGASDAGDLEHDAKKWEPVFRLNHAKTKTPIA